MSQAMDLATKKLGLDRDTGQGGAEEQSIDDVMAELDKGEITEAKRTSLKLRVAEMKERIRLLEDRAAHGAKPEGSTANAADDTKAAAALGMKREIAANAAMFLKEGVNADTVAKYLQSSLSGLSGNLSIAGPVGAADIPGLVTSIANALKPNGGGGDPEIKTLLKALADNAASQRDEQMKTLLQQNRDLLVEVKNIKTGGGDKVGSETKRGKVKIIKPDFTVQELEDDGSPIILSPAPGGGQNNIDWEKEKNRHNEEVEKIRETRHYHEGLVETLQDTTERIGEGLAKNAEREPGEEGERVVAKSGAAGGTFTCPDCKIKIPIYPETPDQVTCTKCGQIYKRSTKTVEVKE